MKLIRSISLGKFSLVVQENAYGMTLISCRFPLSFKDFLLDKQSDLSMYLDMDVIVESGFVDVMVEMKDTPRNIEEMSNILRTLKIEGAAWHFINKCPKCGSNHNTKSLCVECAELIGVSCLMCGTSFHTFSHDCNEKE